MSLPKKQSWDMAQTTWAQQLDPLIACALTQGQQLDGVKLINGTTVVNHKLSRKLQGWYVVDVNAAATIYSAQASNQMPDKTLVLISNAACTVSLWVY